MNKHDLMDTLKRMRYDATAFQAKLTDVMEAVSLSFPDDTEPLKCEVCGSPHRSRMRLEEHIYRQHDDTRVPEHYLAAERAAGFDTVGSKWPG